MFQKILIPLDGSLQSQAALEPARHMAHWNHSEIVLVRFPGLPQEAEVTPLAPVSPEAYARERIRCERYLKRMANELFQAGLKVSWEVVQTHEDALSNLLWAIQHFQVDLVVMTSHSRSGVKRMLRGSIAEMLIRQAPCPVLVIGKKSQLLQNFLHRPLAL